MRRVRRLVPVVAVAGAALGLQLAHDPVAVASPEDRAATDDALAAEGEQLYLTGCSSCHGLEGEGIEGRAPTLVGVGAAAVDFWVGTGRMPAVHGIGEQSMRKQPVYDAEQIDALTAHIATFGPGGPPVPEVDLATADLANGGVLFRANCAACHNASGIGGALSYGNYAPSLHDATAVQVVEAMRIGPGQMPVFEAQQLSDAEATDIAAYVEYLRAPEDPGGLSLGRVGPVTEGFVALLFGLGGIALISAWIVGKRRHV